MGLEVATYISDLNQANPLNGDSIAQGDDHIRLLKSVLKSSFPLVNGPLNATMVPFTPVGNIAATTVAAALAELDSEKPSLTGSGATGSWPISITGNAASASTAADVSDNAIVTAKIADGAVTGAKLASTAVADSLGYTPLGASGGTLTGPLNEAEGTAVASAGTVNLDTATGNFLHITGTTAITVVTLAQGAERTVVFDGALTLTHSAGLILPSGANITTEAGDVAIFRGEGTGVTRCVVYQRANGSVLVPPQQGLTITSPMTVSGSSITVTGIPGTARRITVLFWRIPLNGSGGTITLQLGDSGGIETTGYEGSNASFALGGTAGADNYGTFELVNLSDDGLSWHEGGKANFSSIIGKTLSSTITQMKINFGASVSNSNGRVRLIIEE